MSLQWQCWLWKITNFKLLFIYGWYIFQERTGIFPLTGSTTRGYILILINYISLLCWLYMLYHDSRRLNHIFWWIDHGRSPFFMVNSWFFMIRSPSLPMSRTHPAFVPGCHLRSCSVAVDQGGSMPARSAAWYKILGTPEKIYMDPLDSIPIYVSF